MAQEEGPTRRVAVKIFTASRILTGYVHIPHTGYRTRVSDLMNHEGFEFLPITDAILYSADGSEALSREPCVILNKHLVHVVIPEDGEEGEPGSKGGEGAWTLE